MSEYCEVYCLDTPRARKPHRCEECRGTIAVGERYNRHHGIFDGGPFSTKSCKDCEILRNDMDEGKQQEEWMAFGGLHEAVFDAGESDFVLRFVAIVRKRGVTIHPWMAERESELLVAAGKGEG